LPGLGALASLTYLFGFFAIPVISAELDACAGMNSPCKAKRSWATTQSGQEATQHEPAQAQAAVTGEPTLTRQAVSAGESVIVVGAGEQMSHAIAVPGTWNLR
jgi:hypothetical protein